MSLYIQLTKQSYMKAKVKPLHSLVCVKGVVVGAKRFLLGCAKPCYLQNKVLAKMTLKFYILFEFRISGLFLHYFGKTAFISCFTNIFLYVCFPSMSFLVWTIFSILHHSALHLYYTVSFLNLPSQGQRFFTFPMLIV